MYNGFSGLYGYIYIVKKNIIINNIMESTFFWFSGLFYRHNLEKKIHFFVFGDQKYTIIASVVLTDRRFEKY